MFMYYRLTASASGQTHQLVQIYRACDIMVFTSADGVCILGSTMEVSRDKLNRNLVHIMLCSLQRYLFEVASFLMRVI